MARISPSWFRNFRTNPKVKNLSIALNILRRYSLSEIRDVDYLGGAGGFSGAQIWKVRTSKQNYCLRRWPLSHPDRERLDWINLVLVHASTNDCPFVATPIESNSGARYVFSGGHFWELSHWMPGDASFERDPNVARLNNAIACLARFHLASAQVNLGFQKSENATARVSALQNAGGPIEAIARVPASQCPGYLADLRRVVLDKGINHAIKLARALQPFVQETFPVQPVIRDVWHDHLLFTDDELTGLVDFGSMQIDSVALDLSRVLGSLVGKEPNRWHSSIETYSKIRPLSPHEIDFVFALDPSAVFLSSLNWLKWILLENRNFESEEHVEKRIRHLIGRLVESPRFPRSD